MASFLPATQDSILQATEAEDPSETISMLYQVLEDPSSSRDALDVKVVAIKHLTEKLAEENRAEDLFSLFTKMRPFFSSIAKARAAKTVKGILESVCKIAGTSDLQIALCKEMVQWTRAEKQFFLRQRLEERLAAILMENKEYSEALTLLNGLVQDVRGLDDKPLLVNIYLLQSKLHVSLRDVPRAKAAVTAAKTAANAVHVPPAQQGAIDFQSGILHTEEYDYNTAFSYFQEAFEIFEILDEPTMGTLSLKYMLLCLNIMNAHEHVAFFLDSWIGVAYRGPDLNVIKAVTNALSKRSLKLLEIALRDHKAQIEKDPVFHRHLSSLYDTALELNLFRLIEPFSRVEIAHISELITRPVDDVERKLSQMILDKKFTGKIDQGCLVIFDDPKMDALYPATLETISNIRKVVNSLCARSAKIIE